MGNGIEFGVKKQGGMPVLSPLRLQADILQKFSLENFIEA